MSHYLFQATYTVDSWKAFVKKPVNRTEVIRSTIEGLGGKLHGAWFAFGAHDVLGIIEMPDNASAAALAIAATAGGGLKSFQTTPLMTIEEGVQAMKKAGKSGYRPPGK